jgi:hypothetical protein
MENSLESAFVFLSEMLGGHRELEFRDSEEGGMNQNAFTSFEETTCKRVAAIDGSSYDILDGEFFIVGGRRTGYVIADEKEILEREVGDIKIDFLGEKGVKTTVAKELMREMNLPEKPHEQNEVLRQIEEHLLARKVIEKLERDDIILMDGSFEMEEPLAAIARENVMRAHKKGIHIVGVSKKCGLCIKNVPVSTWVKRNGDKLFSTQRWYYPLFDGCYIVKFHPLSRFVFRVDTDRRALNVQKVLGAIAVTCNDICFLGYPYPLADIHNHVTIKSHDSFAIQLKLQEMAIKKGISLEEWETLFFDYHRYLW